MNPLRAGIALSITVALMYALCTLAWALAPGPFLGLMNSLFHGLDFSSLVRPAPFAWQGFALPLLVLSARALVAGAVLAWLPHLLVR